MVHVNAEFSTALLKAKIADTGQTRVHLHHDGSQGVKRKGKSRSVTKSG